MCKVMNGNTKIIELQGTTGSSPAIDRGKGFAKPYLLILTDIVCLIGEFER